MKLQEKGKIIPPPVLSTYSEIVSKEIQSWQQIISATHWEIWDNNKPNGADFYVGEFELGHIHLDDMLHLASTKELSEALIKAGLAKKFPYGANWIQFKISDEKSARHAIWLFKLHYDKLLGADSAQLLRVISEK
ncbi:MAG: luciferase family protein [Bacteroidia bacterium]